MKKLIALLLAVLMLFSVAACGGNNDAAEETADATSTAKIAVVTGTTSQGEDEVVGAQSLIKKFGADKVLYDTYPDNFTEEQETVIAKITQFADDPDVKAVIVSQAVPGTAEAFTQIKEKRSDIICLAATSQEDPAVITEIADIIMDNNPRARGYLMVKTAHDLGCDTFVHVSFPRHMAMESMQVRHAIMEKACEEFGMKFVDETAPDPTDTSAGGKDGALTFMYETTPKWIEEYGQNSAYFCTNDAETEPLLKCLMENGGYFIEADLPSPLMGYPAALALDVSGIEAGNWDEITAAVETAVCEKGGAGRFGTWKVSLGYSLTYGLGVYAMGYAEGEYDSVDVDDVKAVLDSLGAEFNFSKYINATDGVSYDNFYVVYEDTYIMGDPGKFAGNMDVEIPDWCYTIGVEG